MQRTLKVPKHFQKNNECKEKRAAWMKQALLVHERTREQSNAMFVWIVSSNSRLEKRYGYELRCTYGIFLFVFTMTSLCCMLGLILQKYNLLLASMGTTSHNGFFPGHQNPKDRGRHVRQSRRKTQDPDPVLPYKNS